MGYNESIDSRNRGNYRKLDSVFERRLHRELTENERLHSGVFTGISPDIQNDLIACIDSII